VFVDGVSIFKNSSESIIPVFLINTNILFKYRFELTNIILIGLISTKIEISYLDYISEIVKALNNALQEEFMIYSDSFT
jgi:hypothetical protein